MVKKLISVIVPVYNETLNIDELYERILGNFLSGTYDYEIIYVDNCSTDDTVYKIKQLTKKDRNVRCIRMSRNFGGSQPSIIAGINNAQGDAIITIDGDLQDPPEAMVEFIEKWEEGYQVVYGVRTKRQGPLVMRFGYKMFSMVFKNMAYIDFPLYTGDYGLIDRVVANEINELEENDIVYRGLRAWVGFKQIGVGYTRYDRSKGVSSSNLIKNFRWAARWICNYSEKPLQWISNLAATLTFVSLLSIIYYVFSHFTRTDIPTGISTIVILILFFSAVQLLSLSILGTYIALIVRETKGRPRYIIKEIINPAPCSNDGGNENE